MTEADSRFDVVQTRYHASLAGKRADIEQSWRAVRADYADTASQETLLRLMHRLAGSAESCGFTGIGRIAAQTDTLLDQLRCSGGPAQQTAVMCTMLETLASEIGELLVELQHGVES